MTPPSQSEINRALFGKHYREQDLQNTILQYLALEKVWAIRINTSTMIVEDANGKKRPVRSHSGGKGIADIQALVQVGWGRVDTVHGTLGLCVPLWIEVKSSTGKQSSEQRSFELDVVTRGHRYLIARSIEDVIKTLREVRC